MAKLKLRAESKRAFFGKERRRTDGLAGFINEAMDGEAGDEEVVPSTDFVIKPDAQQGTLLQPRNDRHGIIVERWFGEFHPEFNHWQEISLRFQLTIRQAAFFEQCGPSNLKPGQIVSVIDDTHHISFSVAYGDLGA